MKFDNTISILAKVGLFGIISQARYGFIAEALADRKRVLISSSTRIGSWQNRLMHICKKSSSVGYL